jgi:hypothetical protein
MIARLDWGPKEAYVSTDVDLLHQHGLPAFLQRPVCQAATPSIASTLKLINKPTNKPTNNCIKNQPYYQEYMKIVEIYKEPKLFVLLLFDLLR